jgi:hypothetical protein
VDERFLRSFLRLEACKRVEMWFEAHRSLCPTDSRRDRSSPFEKRDRADIRSVRFLPGVGSNSTYLFGYETQSRPFYSRVNQKSGGRWIRRARAVTRVLCC